MLVEVAIAIWVVNDLLCFGGIDIVSELYISYPAAWSDPLVGILPFSTKIFTFRAGLLVAVYRETEDIICFVVLLMTGSELFFFIVT